ncbi:hypothetical protein G7Y89_g10225 [Cudoniella acicularis]|uniref:Secretory lipase-domain-containing protein n=1 Tax=Cudoniella acicularis TaxID=354080 RepID=A0A8H4RFX5_9HELO|nr:hypothetical protein G7Y89_g10225 [Cudoniella acicularis]
MFSKPNALIGALLVAFSYALPSPNSHVYDNGASYSSTPLPPSQDPFYTAPTGFEFKPPGTILRLRRAPGNLTSVFGNCSSAYNILYRTTDSQYKPAWAVTTLYIPSIPNNGDALLSYQFPYNSVDADFSPSYSFYTEPSPDVTAGLSRGWFVSVPDYEGPLASDGAGILEAHSTIDSIRAVLFSNLGLSSDVRIALWGYSGGAIPSEWALEFQEQYAPELNISGAALGGLPPNVTDVIFNVIGTIWASHAMSASLGVLTQYPAAYDFFVSKMKTEGPYNRTGFLTINNMSFAEAHVVFAGQNMFDYFDDGSEILQFPIIKTPFQENSVMTYHGVPRAPLFVYKAIHDEVTLVGDTDAFVARNCLMGTNILYQRNTVGEHLDEFTNGDGRALDWLETVLDGSYAEKYSTEGCTVMNVTVNIVDSGT